jgi:hypothetical protein
VTRRRRPHRHDLMRHLRFRGPVRLGPAPDPDRRRCVPPTASLAERIDDFVGWMIAAGFQPEEAKRRGEWIREYHQQTGKNFLALPPEEQLAIIAESDRRLDELERQAEALADVDPEESEH